MLPWSCRRSRWRSCSKKGGGKGKKGAAHQVMATENKERYQTGTEWEPGENPDELIPTDVAQAGHTVAEGG